MWIVRDKVTKEVFRESRTPLASPDPYVVAGISDNLEVLLRVENARAPIPDVRYQKYERVETEPGDGTIQVNYNIVSRSKAELREMAKAEYEKRVDAVADDALRDQTIVRMIALLEKRDRTGSLNASETTEATTLLSRANWLNSMHARLQELRSQINNDQPFDFDTGWPSI